MYMQVQSTPRTYPSHLPISLIRACLRSIGYCMYLSLYWENVNRFFCFGSPQPELALLLSFFFDACCVFVSHVLNRLAVKGSQSRYPHSTHDLRQLFASNAAWPLASFTRIHNALIYHNHAISSDIPQMHANKATLGCL